MTNFNGMNPLINSMLNYVGALKNQNLNNNNPQLPNQPITQNTANANSQLVQNLSTNAFVKTPTIFLNNQTEQVALQETVKMNNEVVQKYLQNLLNMPESIDKFLKFADSKAISKEGYQFLKIFIENMLSNKELSQLLKQNSNDAIQKLLNAITQSLKEGADVSQLKELLSVLNVIHTASSNSTNTLRELFLLYIPINYQIYKEDTNFDKITADNEDGIKNSVLSILFETCNFSNVLATLNFDNNVITIEIHANSEFPFESFEKLVSILPKESSLRVACDFLKIKDYGTNSQKQNFKIISDDFVPLNVLNASQIVINTIFKLDNNIEEINES